MRKETDLARVKMIAHVLLDMPIAETSFSPAILLTRDPFGQSGAISSIYVDEDACYYASSGEVGDGFQIYRIDLKDFSTRLYFSTGSDNTATFGACLTTNRRWTNCWQMWALLHPLS